MDFRKKASVLLLASCMVVVCSAQPCESEVCDAMEGISEPGTALLQRQQSQVLVVQDPITPETAPFSEEGYQAVAEKCCTADMDTYIRRVIKEHLKWEICNEYGLLGLVPWYSCEAG